MMELKTIAVFHSPFKSKFGIPKQSGLADEVPGQIELLPPFRNADALRGIEGYDYLWLVWGFSANPHAASSPVVRPPVLGGNQRMGVFATRSPFRPNPIGLSSVRLVRVQWDGDNAPVLHVNGADLMDGTPIYDIKPYLSYADAHPDARSGFSQLHSMPQLQVTFAPAVQHQLDTQQQTELAQVLSLDPRPRYHNDPDKTYGMPYGKWDVKFRIDGTNVTVIALETLSKSH